MARRGVEGDLELLFYVRELVAVADNWKEREPLLAGELIALARRTLIEVVDAGRATRPREE